MNRHFETPHGLTVDVAGGLWVALYGGGAVHRYDSDGILDAVVELPTPKPTACTFGGAELSTLYVTTTQEGIRPGTDSLAGSVFSLEPGVRGPRGAHVCRLSGDRATLARGRARLERGGSPDLDGKERPARQNHAQAPMASRGGRSPGPRERGTRPTASGSSPPFAPGCWASFGTRDARRSPRQPAGASG